MLRGYNDRVDALDLAVLAILHGNLTLAVRPEPRKAAVLSRLCQRLRQIVRVGDRRRHQLLGFVAGKSEHHALIACALLVRIVIGRIHAHRDILRLLVDRRQNRAASSVEAILRVIVADLRDRVSRNARNVHIAVRRNLAHHQHKTGRRRALARHTRLRVLGQDRIQYAVGNLVADLIGMSLCYRFRCKNSLAHLIGSPFVVRGKENALCKPAKRTKSSFPSSFDCFAGIGTLQGCIHPESRLPDFIGPFPPSLLIRLFGCQAYYMRIFRNVNRNVSVFPHFCPYSEK